MSDLWIASHVLLWIAVVVQGVLIVALMRQVGSLLIRVGAVHSLDAGYGPDIGTPAPWVPEIARGNDSRALLLTFLSTNCGTCEAIVPALNAVSEAYSATVVVVIVAEDPVSVLKRWTERHRLKPEALAAPEAFKAYGIDGTPYAFVLDSDRTVAARGGVNHIEHLEDLIRRCTLSQRVEDEPLETTPEPIPLLPAGGA